MKGLCCRAERGAGTPSSKVKRQERKGKAGTVLLHVSETSSKTELYLLKTKQEDLALRESVRSRRWESFHPSTILSSSTSSPLQAEAPERCWYLKKKMGLELQALNALLLRPPTIPPFLEPAFSPGEQIKAKREGKLQQFPNTAQIKLRRAPPGAPPAR